MSSVQNYTIYRARRANTCASVSNNNLMATRVPTISNTPAKQSKILPQKKLEFNSKKRQRPPSPVKSSKKSKLCGKAGWSLMICLYDEDCNFSVNFRCFSENDVVPTEISELSLVPNQSDDDCKTQDKEIKV